MLGTAGDNQSTISYSRCPAGKSLGLGDPSIPTSDNLGVNNYLMYFLIPIHLWRSPILYEVGLVRDWLTRVKKSLDCWVEIVAPEEVSTKCANLQHVDLDANASITEWIKLVT
jgi:hypothetical protein